MKNYLPTTLPRFLFLVLSLASFQLPAFGQAYANAQSTVRPKNALAIVNVQKADSKRSVSAILFALEEAYHTSFNYDHAVVSEFVLREDFSWNKNEKLERVLKRLTQQAGLQFEKVDDDNYLIYAQKKGSRGKTVGGTSLITAPESTVPSLDLSPLAQTDVEASTAIAAITVSGVVRDEASNPLPGVNVMVKGTTNGTTSDADGKYVLTVSDGSDVLIFSFIGYTTQEVAVGDRSVIDVAMTPDVTSLQEVVVVGYGEQKRTNVLGSVATMKPEEVQDIPAANLSTILQGRMPGVHIGQSSGRPGAPTTLSIRTRGSWNNEPVLFVIDGFIRDQSAFDLLDPTEIESISVLKDAAAAVYGARAAGGVVMVKTKRGKIGKAKINYSGSYGISDATQFTDMLSAYDHAVLVNDALKITEPTEYEDQAGWSTDDELEHFRTLDHNWLDQAWKNSSTVRHTVNVSGGSETVRYFGSVTHYNEKGNLPGTQLKKYTLRMGIDADLTKDLTASLTLSGDNKLDEMPFNTEDNNPDPMDGTFKTLLMVPRWIPSYINGLPVNGPNLASHPLEVDRINSYIRSKGSSLILNTALEYKVPVVEGLRLKMAYSMSERNAYGKQHRIGYSLYNFEMTGGNNHIFTDIVSGNPRRIKNDERLQETYDRGTNYQLNGSIMYDRTFGMHNVGALLVYEQAESEGNGILAMREENLIEGYERQEGFSEEFDRTSSNQSAFSRLSYIGRVNYNYAEKYLLEAAFRYEGSVRFMPSTRWGFFPSVAAGWRISEEDFFKNNVSFINNLKLRGSAGLVGNDDVAPRQWELTYGIATGSYLGGSSVTNGLNPRNSGIKATTVIWEKSRSYNGGLDIGFTNRINLTFDYFRRYTYDILDARNSVLPTSTGIDKMPKENYGKMQSWGFDASIGYDGEAGGDFTYNIGVNMSWARSKVVERFQSPGVKGTWEDEIGKMPGGEPGFIALGIMRTQEQLDAFMEANPGYLIDGEALELGMLYYKDVGGPGRSDIPDGVIDDNDRRFIAPAVSALGFNFNLGAAWKGIRVNTIIGLSGFGTKEFYDKEGLTAPTEKLNGPAFWRDHWTPENPMAAYPRAGDYGLDGQKSTFWMRDGLSMELNILNVSYDMPKAWSQKLGIPQVRLYFSGRNLWNIINPIEYKDPSIARFNSYPTLRTYNFGINLSL